MSSASARDNEYLSSKDSWDTLNARGSDNDDDAREKAPLLVDENSATSNNRDATSSQEDHAEHVFKGRGVPKKQSTPVHTRQGGGSKHPTGKSARSSGNSILHGEVEPLAKDKTSKGWFVNYPEWFLNSAVNLREESQPPQCLVLSNEPIPDHTHSGGVPPKYTLDGDTYEQVLDIVFSLTKPPSTHGLKTQPKSWNVSAAILLQSPDPDKLDFLNAVARRLAKDVDADLLDLSQGLLEDVLYQWFHDLGKPDIFSAPSKYLLTEKGYPRDSNLERAFCSSFLHLDDCQYLVDRLLTARSWKRRVRGHEYAPRPLIILLPDVTAFTVRYSSTSTDFLGLLYAEVKRRRQDAGTPTLIVGTAPSSRTHDQSSSQSDMGRQTISHVHKQLHLDPSLVMDVSPRWFSWATLLPPTRLFNRVDWWARLRLALAHELQALGSEIRGLEVLQPGSRAPLPAIHTLLAHSAWTGDMTIKAFRQIVARARRKGRLDADDMLSILAHVAKKDAPKSFGSWDEMPMNSAIVVWRYLHDDVPREFWRVFLGFLGLVASVFFVLWLTVWQDGVPDEAWAVLVGILGAVVLMTFFFLILP